MEGHYLGEGVKALREALKADRAFVASKQRRTLRDALTAGESVETVEARAERRGRVLRRDSPADDDDNYDKEGLDRMSSGSSSSGTEDGLETASATGGGSADIARSGSRNETFAFAPNWLFGSWWERGCWGFWNPALTGSPPKLVGMWGGGGPY